MSEISAQKDKDIEKSVVIGNIDSDEIIRDLRKLINEDQNPAYICETRLNNPNYLAIIHANQRFCEAFNIDEENLIGKNYDFLLSGIDLDYSSEDHLEYIRLVKSVKSLQWKNYHQF